MSSIEYNVPRSPQWPKVEKAHLAMSPYCLACGPGIVNRELNVHHVVPFHIARDPRINRPDLELDHRNLRTLGVSCGHHITLGHDDDYQSYNLDLDEDIKKYQGQSEVAIKSSAEYQVKLEGRKILSSMTDADFAQLNSYIAAHYPVLEIGHPV